MTRVRISILGAMGLVLIAGLVLALVRIEQREVSSGLEGWVNVARYVVVTSLVMATYRARYCKCREADWWFGFALGGWSYFLFTGDLMWQWSWPTQVPNSLVQSLPHWIASLIPLSWMDRVILTHPFLAVAETQFYETRIVEALLVLSAAVVGGVICLVLSWRRGATPRDQIQ